MIFQSKNQNLLNTIRTLFGLDYLSQLTYHASNTRFLLVCFFIEMLSMATWNTYGVDTLRLLNTDISLCCVLFRFNVVNDVPLAIVFRIFSTFL